MNQKWFNSLSIEKRFKLIQQKGVFIATRKHQSHFVSLFTLDGNYIELWKTISTNQIQWIELCNNTDVLYDYVKDAKV